MAIARKIWRILTIKCDETTRLMSASLDGDLSFADRLAYRLHALGCRSCHRFLKQIRFLRKAATGSEDDASTSAETLSSDARQRIAGALRHAQEKPTDDGSTA